MLGWPCSGWDGREPWPVPPDCVWVSMDGDVLHTFTHFQLRLKVMAADLEATASDGDGEFLGNSEFDPRSLPNLMRKVYEKALPYFEPDAAREASESEIGEA